MALLGLPSPWLATALLLLLFLLPPCLCVCPRSCSCPNPKEVHCTFRHLLSMPRNLPKETERVNLGYNSISAVGASDFKNLRQLEMLMLHGNDITSVASGSFYYLRNLQILKLSYNKLKSIDRSILEGLTNLVRLHLDHNLISFIEPFSFNGLTSLKLLQLEGNKLRDLHPHTFVTLSVLGTFWGSGLRHLHLADNQLEYMLPGTLQHLSKLEVLSLHGNPWSCDCNLNWLLDWAKKHEGVIKCKKERDLENCATCASPQPLNNSLIFQLSVHQLSCIRPSVQSPLKMGESSVWDDQEPDLPYTKDLEKPLGHLTFVLSDSHGNRAHVACDVTHPVEGTSMAWEQEKRSEGVAVNVTLMSLLECEIDRDTLQNLWRLVAYYYESPAILERGARHENASKASYQYSQATSKDSPYFTELKGHLIAEPTWLLQPKVTLQLNRLKTTTKKLVLNFSAFISKHISARGMQDDSVFSWALIPRGAPGRIQIVPENSEVTLECEVLSSGHQSVEWMLPDLTTLEKPDSQKMVSEHNRLIIKNVSLSDSGLYHCFVQTETGVDIVSYRLTVREHLLSPSELNGKKMSIENGESLSLPCSVTSAQPIETIWYLPMHRILKSSSAKERIYVSQNNTLIIENVVHEDAGEYSCLAANIYGVDMLSHSLVVTGEKEEDSIDVSLAKGSSPLLENEEIEGSGYQEIKQPSAKQTLQKVDGKHRALGGPYRQGNKGKRIKDNVRKPNKSVKELDPGRWEQMLAKAKSKISTVQPATIMTTLDTTTIMKTTTTTPTPMTSSPTTTVDTTTAISFTSKQTNDFSTKQLVKPPHQKTDNSNFPILTSATTYSTTISSINLDLVTQAAKQVDRHIIEEKIKSKIPTPNSKRRPPYRRRPPSRRFRPFKPTRTPPSPTDVLFTTVSTTAAPESNSPTMAYVPTLTEKTKIEPFVDSEIHNDHGTQKKDAVLRKYTLQNSKKNTSGKEGSQDAFQDITNHKPVKVTSKTPLASVTLAPILAKSHTNGHREKTDWTRSKTIKDKYIHMISVTRSPSIQVTNIKTPITQREALTTEEPPKTKNNRQRLDNTAVRSQNPALPLHPWLTERKKQNSATSMSHTASPFWTYTDHIQARPTVHGSRNFFSHDRTWQFLNSRSKSTGVTNRPEITAQTAYIPWTAATAIPRTIAPYGGASSRVRDYLLFSKLRNRYRQSQIDSYRLTQLGRLVTPKPRTYQPTPRPPAPNFPSIYQPVTPTSVTAVTGKPSPTASILYGSRWHYSHFGAKKLSTPLPFPNLMGSGVKPRIVTTESITVSALAEANVLLRCQASGDPIPTISWTKVSTGATIQASTKHGNRFEVLSNGTFVIKNVQLQDRGQYLCTAKNKFGSDRMVVTLTVQTEPPKIVGPKHREASVYLGKSINLDCNAAGKPQAQVSWILPDRNFVREVAVLDRPVSLFPNGTLSIHSTNFSSKGDYKCIASNAAGADVLTYRLHVAALPPTIQEEASESITINTGGNIYVHCTAKGEPSPFLKWVLPDGSQMKPTQFIGRRLFIFPNGTLYIKTVAPTDEGKYECSATNIVGIAKRVVNMDIRQESSGTWRGPSQQHRVSAMYGSTVFLHCPESTGSHRGTIWRLPSKSVLEHRYSPHRHITAFPNGTLRILQLTEKDGGSYLCMYQRPNGEDMELFQLEVLMKPPKIENVGSQQKRVNNGENFLVDCVASGHPDPEVSWSLPDGTVINNALQSDDSGTRSRRYIIFGNGTLLLQQMGKTDEGDYTCYAKNTLGEDAMKVNVQVIQKLPQISSKDQVSLLAPLGQSAQMKCDATGDPPPTIIWISPQNEIITSSSTKYQILNDGTLIIKKISLTDQGKYACVARNIAGDDIKNVKLQVEVMEPHINGNRGHMESKVLAVSYQTLMLHCTAEGMPEPQVMWTTPYGMSLPTPYVGGRFQVHKNGSLELRGVRKTDEGQFLCVAKNYLGKASLAIELEVASLAEKPSFPMPNIEVLPLKPDGDDITLDCQAVGKPKPEFIWILPNSTVLAPGMKLKRFIHSLGNGTLHIIQPLPSDKGVYRCLAKNVAGQAEKRYALEPGRKPQIRGTAAPMKISFGQTLNMPCTVDGWPQATITWTLPNGLVLDRPQAIGRVTYLSNGTLQLRETTKFDRGTYICKATNTFGSTMLSYPVTIMVFPPQITNAPPSITRVTKGSPVTLHCIATGIPKPDISWTLPGRTTLVPNNRFTVLGGIHMTEDGSLVIQDPSLMNSGIYKCNAKNALGTDFKATYLQVI